MLVIIYTEESTKNFSIQVSSIPEVMDYLSSNEPELANYISDTSLVYVVADSMEVLKPVTLVPEVINTTFEGYDILIISEKLEGSYGALGTVIAEAVANAAVQAGANALVAQVIGFVASQAVLLGISYAIGQLLQALAPTQNIAGDASKNQKQYSFNGIPNIVEQGGGVPMLFGEGFCGGVRIATNLYIKNIQVTGSASVDTTIPNKPSTTIKDNGNSSWNRYT